MLACEGSQRLIAAGPRCTDVTCSLQKVPLDSRLRGEDAPVKWDCVMMKHGLEALELGILPEQMVPVV